MSDCRCASCVGFVTPRTCIGKQAKCKPIAAYLTEAEFEALELYRAQLSHNALGTNVTRAEAIRVALRQVLGPLLVQAGSSVAMLK